MPAPPPAALAPLVPQMSGQASIYSNAHMQLFSYIRPGSKKNSNALGFASGIMARSAGISTFCPCNVIYY